MKKTKKNKLYFIILSTALVCSLGVFYAFKAQDRNFLISKNFDIFHSLFRELNLFYVDSTDVDQVFSNAIDGLLSSYDPYTTYIPESQMSELKYITTGEYGGIGAIISKRGEAIIIAEPYENMPAQEAGLLFGDELVEIDGISMAGKSVSFASDCLKGQPNTTLELLIRREGEKKLIKKSLQRKLIQMNPVEYAGLLKPGVGYVYLSSFTDKSYQELKQTLINLNKQGAHSLILDLRDNGGGLLSEAVSICNLFVDKGEIIVTTKGKVPQWDKTYKTLTEPLFKDMPVVVLTNKLSASSSEIVAGALQDLDRAVILGSRTFGKGLVQTTRELAYNGVLKVTTAKYYIPSGRCIQAVNYSNGRSGRLPDSLTTRFSTRNGRPVRDGGGISPDVSCVEKEYSNFCWQLVNNLHCFDFANDYYRKHAKISTVENFKLSEQDFKDFGDYVRNSNFTYELYSKNKLNELRKLLESEGYWEEVSDDFKSLESKLVHDLDKDLETFRTDIERILSLEIIRRYYYQKGEIQESLKTDKCVSKALDLLMDRENYEAILKPSEQQTTL
ncbi:MAG: S41 family peptidase [Bacteroidales bacterium]|nr:S41 family peptidase [Bacteroidales bacterium]